MNHASCHVFRCPQAGWILELRPCWPRPFSSWMFAFVYSTPQTNPPPHLAFGPVSSKLKFEITLRKVYLSLMRCSLRTYNSNRKLKAMPHRKQKPGLMANLFFLSFFFLSSLYVLRPSTGVMCRPFGLWLTLTTTNLGAMTHVYLSFSI